VLDTDDPLAARIALVDAAEHRLRGSLAVIAGWAGSLGEHWEEIPEEARRHGIEVVRAGADRLAEDIDRLLEETRTDLRARSLTLVPVDVAALAAEASGDLAALAVRHEVAYAGPASAVALADDASVREVLDHLLRDALRRSPAGSAITTSVSVADDHVVLRVAAPGEPDDLALHLARTLVVGMAGTATGDGSYTFPCRIRRQFDEG
jgi:signal transduction histidine kinase